MDQETWEIVEILFPHRAEALREAQGFLEKVVQVAANPPEISNFWGDTDTPDKKGAGLGVRTTSTSDGAFTVVDRNSFSQDDDLTREVGRQAR